MDIAFPTESRRIAPCHQKITEIYRAASSKDSKAKMKIIHNNHDH